MSEKTIIYKFLDFEIDTALRELRCAGTVIALQPKVFDLLIFLLINRARAVSKDELQDAVWSGTIVSETALSRAIMKARKAIGDDAERQNILKTVHGHGYRFVAEVFESVAPSTQVEADSHRVREVGITVGPAVSGVASSSKTASSRSWGGWLITAALLTLMGVGFLLLNRPTNSQSLKIAVLPVQNLTDSSDLAWVPLGLMSLINRQLSDSTDANTVSASRMLSLVPEPGQALPANVMHVLHTEMGVSHVLRTTLLQVGQELALDYQIVRPDGQSPISRLLGANPTSLAQNMIRSVIASLPNAGTRKEYRVVSESDFATEAYAKGLALQLEGRVREARDFFEVSVAEDPQSFWPSYELALTMRRLAESAEDYEQALAFTRKLLPIAKSTAGARAEVAVRNAAARILVQQGNSDEAREEYQAAVATAKAGGEQSVIPTLLVNLSIIARNDRDFETARGMLYQALEIEQKLGEPPNGYIHHGLAQIAFSERDFPAAETSYRKGLEIFRAQNRRREEASSISALSRLLIRLGRWTEADRLIEESLALRQELDSAAGVVDSLLSRAELEGRRGDYTRTVGAATDALAQAQKLNSRGRIEAAQYYLLDAHLAMGALSMAEQILNDLRSAQLTTPSSWSVRKAEADFMQANGDFVKADERFAQLFQEAAVQDSHNRAVSALMARAEIARLQKSPEAIELTTQALARARDAGDIVRTGKILLSLADWYLNHNDQEAAAPLVAELQATLGHWPRSQAIRARLDFHRGRHAEAIERMTAARVDAGNAWGGNAQRWFAEVVAE